MMRILEEENGSRRKVVYHSFVVFSSIVGTFGITRVPPLYVFVCGHSDFRSHHVFSVMPFWIWVVGGRGDDVSLSESELPLLVLLDTLYMFFRILMSDVGLGMTYGFPHSLVFFLSLPLTAYMLAFLGMMDPGIFFHLLFVHILRVPWIHALHATSEVVFIPLLRRIAHLSNNLHVLVELCHSPLAKLL